MQLLDGRLVSQKIRSELAAGIEKMQSARLKIPHLAAVLVGHHGASETYVSAKVKACKEIGFGSTLLRFEDTISENELLDQISWLNTNPDIDGILVQLPLPEHISTEKVISEVSPEKDVDGFHPLNTGKMLAGLPASLPATPYGILLLLEHYQVETIGKHAVVLGRSHIVGSPISILLSRNAYPGNCTVTLCHSRTRHLEEICRQGDILISALGRPEFVGASMVKEGAVVVDVGTTRIPDPSRKSGFRLAGDILFPEVSPHCSFITPVPGGVGPMTIAALLKNTFRTAMMQTKQSESPLPT